MKKLFIISVSVFIVSVIIFIIFKAVFDKNASFDGGTISKEEESLEKPHKIEEEKSISPISDEKSVGLFIDKEKERIKYYSMDSGNILEIDFDGRNKKIISTEAVEGVESITWSPSGDRAILKIGSSYFYYNVSLGDKKELKKGVDTVSWSADGTKIIYKYFDFQSGKRSINMADPDGENWENISDTDFRNVRISVIPKTNSISFWNSPSLLDETALEVVSLPNKDKKRVFSSKKGADYKWSPDGKRAIASFSKDDSGESLNTAIIGPDGEYMELGIPTIATKTAWSLDMKTCYFATPTVPKGSKMPDDYELGKISTKDTFWKVNVEDGEKSRLVELEAIRIEIDASEMTVGPGDRSIFFINKKDNLIYRLDF